MNTQTKISANRQKKMTIVSGLSDNFGKAKAVVFTNYQGLTHKQMEGLKKAIKPLEAEFVVAKNTLLQRSINEKLKLEGEHTLEGQTGTLFLYGDIISPLKALAKTIKELNLPAIKFGIMDNDFITSEQVLKLATLPTKETLLIMLVGGLRSPIFGLHRALNWNLQKLVLTLNAVAKAKPASNAAVTADEPTQAPVELKEPETILDETIKEKLAEQPNPIQEPASTEATNPEALVNKTRGDASGGEPDSALPSESSDSTGGEETSGRTPDNENKDEVDSKGGEN